MTHTLELTLSEALRLMRERAGMTKEELGDAIERSRNTVARYETGQQVPRRWADVQAWALACDHDPDLLRDAWSEARRSGWLYGRPPDGSYSQPCLFGGDGHGDDGQSHQPEAA